MELIGEEKHTTRNGFRCCENFRYIVSIPFIVIQFRLTFIKIVIIIIIEMA